MSKKNSRRSVRPYVRARRQEPIGAGGLAAAAGRGRGGVRSAVEQLEPRKMLFTATIGAADPGTPGVGTVTGVFGYVHPILFQPAPTPQPAMTVLEEFEDEQAPWAMNPPRTPPSGTFFQGSGIGIAYPSTGAVVNLQADAPVAPATMDNALRIALSGTGFVAFSFNENVQGGQPRPRRVTGANVVIGPASGGLSTDPVTGTKLELLLNGQVVQTYAGGALAALNAGGNFIINFPSGFDTFRFSSAALPPDNATYNDTFVVDAIGATFPSTTFAANIDARGTGFAWSFSGPVGASVQFLDLDGLDIINTCAVRIPVGGMLPAADPNGDGIVDFNNGIGRIVFRNTNAQTNFTAFGGNMTASMMADPAAFLFCDGFNFNLPSSVAGKFDDFESEGFGYHQTETTPPRIVGLPPVGGSVIIGAPLFPAGANPPRSVVDQAQFNRTDQGIFVEGGANIGSVIVSGVVHGSSQFTGSVGRLGIGLLLGSVNVAGDLGSLVVQSDAGNWAADDLAAVPAQNNPDADLQRPDAPNAHYADTHNQLIVGRTLGEVLIGGRNLMDITVLGDINNPARPSNNVLRYNERESVYGTGAGDVRGERGTIEDTLANNANPAFQQVPYGATYFRNDTILGAEFIGNPSTAVQVVGNLGLEDPTNAADPSDVFSFAVDGTTTVTVNVDFNFFAQLRFDPIRGFGTRAYARIVDQDGRVVAAAQTDALSTDALPIGGSGVRFTFRPDHADVYYLVIGSPVDGQFPQRGVRYITTMTGLAPVTFGQYTSGARTGYFLAPPAITAQAGSIGAIRIGAGYVGGDGAEASPAGLINTVEDISDLMDVRETTISAAANLYAFIAGSDIAGVRVNAAGRPPGLQIFIGGNLGAFHTGMSELVGGGPNGVDQGDVQDLSLSVGGSIGVLDIRGNVRFDSDSGITESVARPVNITTGTSGGRGNIGQILVGGFIDASNFNLRTSPGSTIDLFQTGYRGGTDAGAFDEATPVFTLGAGSDIRFVSFTRIENPTNRDAFLTLTYGQTIRLVDDSGTVVEITLSGGVAGVNGNAEASTATIRVLPINGSQGGAIGQINADLFSGANLVINAVTPGVASIGDVTITTHQSTVLARPRLSSLLVGGPGQVDVWRVRQLVGDGGLQLFTVQNTSPGGDFVMIDATSLDQVIISSGDLGRTQTNGAGPRQLGSFLGVGGMATGGDIGGAIGLNAGALNANWNGNTYIPVNIRTTDVPGDVYLEDIGGPLDPYLNGVIVRTGDLQLVRVNGAVGDVILQGGDVVTVTANSAGTVEFGRFKGIVGTIYARVIGVVDVGDGLADPGTGPLATAGIFAEDDIVRVVSNRMAGAQIRGVIAAANIDPAVRTTIGTGDVAAGIELPVGGVGAVDVVNGRFDGAFIGAATLDSFWDSARLFTTTNDADDPLQTGDIARIRAVNTDFFRSRTQSINLNEFTLTGGAYDASRIEATGNSAAIVAAEFRNSTRLGEPLEFRDATIRVSRDLASVTALGATGLRGDLSDLVIDVRGTITGGVTGRNATRLDLRVDHSVQDLFLTGDIRGSSIVAGRIVRARADGDIRSSAFAVAGPIIEVSAGGQITTTEIASNGPDGSIGTIRSAGLFQGSVSSSGPVTLIESTGSDIIADIRTGDADADIGTIRAAGSLLLNTDIRGNLGLLQAGGSIGESIEARGQRAIDVKGDLGSIMVPNGQVYSDVRVSQNITGTITTGRVAALPGNDLVAHGSISAFGRINALDLHGDFDGDIISRSGGIGTVTITDGSFRPNRSIIARDGGIGTVRIIGGHLLGNVISDEQIDSIQVLPNARGFWGDIGVNSGLSQFNPFDAVRNQLPPGVQPVDVFQGPRISAGTNIGEIVVARGSMFETGIYAGHSIGRVFVNGAILNDNVTPGAGGTFIVAGDTVSNVEVNGFAGGLIVAAGVSDLGADGRPGGTGASADTVRFGRVGTIQLKGGAGMTSVSAGINAGADGVYNTADDAVADGLSLITSVTVSNGADRVTAWADNGIGFTSPGVQRGGPGLHQQNPGRVIEFVPPTGLLPKGVPFAFQTNAGETGRITFTGPGNAYWDKALGRLAVINSSFGSRLVVDTDQNHLTDFFVISNDSANISLVSLRGDLVGNSGMYFDGYIERAEMGALDITNVVGAGNDIGQLQMGRVVRGRVLANQITDLMVGGDFGARDIADDAVLDVLGVVNFNVGGDMSGVVTAGRDVINAHVFGSMNRGSIRSGEHIGSVRIDRSLLESRLTAARDITTVRVAGDALGSAIYAGTDLGADGAFGGAGDNADAVSNGSLGTVTVGGNFQQTDIAAGVSRGPDGFIGTADDIVAAGRSSIGSVTITGRVIGSNLSSQNYRIISNGGLGPVVAAGQPVVSQGNFAVLGLPTVITPVTVTDVRVTEDARLYTASITFNQPISQSTLSGALRVTEVRAGAAVITLAEGTDYSLEYDTANNTVRVNFSRAVSDRSLPQTPDLPGPGVYRFDINAAILRGQTQDNPLDGNADGVANGGGDSFSQDAIVGDVGDKLAPNTVTAGSQTVDFYGAADLNAVLDNNYTPDGLPDPNLTYTVRGTLGDHPDSDVNFFRFSGDADVYRVTLRAGQILRLGRLLGNAQLAGRSILDAAGNPIAGSGPFGQTGTEDASLVRLPSTPLGEEDNSFEDNFLVKQTGTYYIMLAADINAVAPADNTAVANIGPIGGALGSYNFTLRVSDDGDSGFAGDTDSGNGAPIVNAPAPIAFAGGDGVFGTGDDLGAVSTNTYTFTLDRGRDGVPNTADDAVRGGNGVGFSTRTAGPDGLFGTADDRLSTVVDSAIGDRGGAGVPDQVSPDIDVFQLNNGAPIAPGTHIRATLRLTETGSNIGLTANAKLQDLRGDVHFSLFETTGATGVSDARLVASPSDFIAVGGQPATSRSSALGGYGFDANGDFFMEFNAPARQGLANATPASFALAVQGAIRSDYQLEIVTQGVGSTAVTPKQNVFIETRGGVISFLEAGNGVATTLEPFSTSVLGFSGLIGGQRVDDYVVGRLVSNINAIFAASNSNIVVSTSPADFEQQNFSTVFLTRSNEPTAFFADGTYGASQHSDAFNADPNDQAVVFVPQLSLLPSVIGNPPTQATVDSLVQSLTAAVTRRIGELVGLRTTTANSGSVTAANSPEVVPGGGYRFANGQTRLSTSFDALVNSNFYLGNQNDVSLLDRVLADRF